MCSEGPAVVTTLPIVNPLADVLSLGLASILDKWWIGLVVGQSQVEMVRALLDLEHLQVGADVSQDAAGHPRIDLAVREDDIRVILEVNFRLAAAEHVESVVPVRRCAISGITHVSEALLVEGWQSKVERRLPRLTLRHGKLSAELISPRCTDRIEVTPLSALGDLALGVVGLLEASCESLHVSHVEHLSSSILQLGGLGLCVVLG